MSLRKIVAISLLAVPLFHSACGKKVPKVTDPTSVALEAFADGRHLKAVWSRYVGGGANDVFSNGNKLQLWGLDTRDNRGPRAILDTPENYSRPLISPDGQTIIFTDKNAKSVGKKRQFAPTIHRVDWNGEQIEQLAEGHAVDIWQDPATQIQWVYFTDLVENGNPMMVGSRIERFNLADPKQRELVYDKSQVTTENIQLSADGKRASCLFPWPDAGVLDLTTNRPWKNQQGCWPSMAPDNSYLSWVFDGAHKNLEFFTDHSKQSWLVNLTEAPGVNGIEVYHPRWTSDARYFTMTGPYNGQTIGKSDATIVDVYLGKFAADFKSVESWEKITSDDHGDFFPDVWIEKGSEAEEYQAPDIAPDDSDIFSDSEWPSDASETLFVWESKNIRANNRTSDGRQSSVVAHDGARFGRDFEMLCDGGWFSTDSISGELLTEYLGGTTGPITLEFVATPYAQSQNGILISHDFFQIRQEGEFLFVVGKDRFAAANQIPPVPLRENEPMHFVLVIEGDTVSLFANSAAQPVTEADETREMVATRRGLSFGTGWAGSLKGIAVYQRAFSAEQVIENTKVWGARLTEPAPRYHVRAKLIAMTADKPPEALDEYRRGLLAYQYEIEEILGGNEDGPAIGDTIEVLHWTLLERKMVVGFPRRPGQSYELSIEKYTDHPELAGERCFNDLLNEPQFYDITTPSVE